MNLDPDAELVQRYATARARSAADEAVTMIDVGDNESIVVSGRADEPPLVIRLAIGAGASGNLPIRHDPPTPLELEHAIEVIENEVMPLAKRLPRPSVLIGVGGLMHDIARAAGKTGAGRERVALSEVEGLFQQLAAVAEGRPAASSGLPPGPRFAATLLILREFMHHVGFGSVDIDAA